MLWNVLPGNPGRVRTDSANSWALLAPSARARNRVGILSARRAQTKVPHETDLLWETLRALNHPGRTRTVEEAKQQLATAAELQAPGRAEMSGWSRCKLLLL
jgi:hypothetical protein